MVALLNIQKGTQRILDWSLDGREERHGNRGASATPPWPQMLLGAWVRLIGWSRCGGDGGRG